MVRPINDPQLMTMEMQEKQELAMRLRQESAEQWQRAVQGLVALPTAITLGIASRTLMMVSFLARGFQTIQMQSQEMRRDYRGMRAGMGTEMRPGPDMRPGEEMGRRPQDAVAGPEVPRA